MTMRRPSPCDDALTFIVTSPTRRSLEGKRKVIRSQVMRGKNRRKLPPRPSSWINGRGVMDAGAQEHSLSSIPARVGSDFSLAVPTSEITPDTLEAIWRLKWAMFPLDLGPPPDETKTSWLEPICNDTACLHFTVFIAKMYSDFMMHGQRSDDKITLAHFVKCLSVLQQRLADVSDDSFISDSTILVVIGLTMAATGLGDFDTARKHIQGLHKMVMLRGGLMAFQGSKQLQAKICRADLGVALATGREPFFFSANISWNSYIAPRKSISVSGCHDSSSDEQSTTSDLRSFLHSLDTRLRLVWDDLAEFVRAVNIAVQSNRGVDVELYQEVMISIHYRLVNLRFDLNAVDETIRLGMLAFASTLFLQWRGVKVRYEHLAQRLQSSISRLRHQNGAMPPHLTFWIYTIGTICVFDGHKQNLVRPALVKTFKGLGLESSVEVRSLLKSILWVDGQHDAPAKQILDALIADLHKNSGDGKKG